MFTIKPFQSIVNSMIRVALTSQTKISDFSVGSVARTIMEAPAVEIEALYLQMLLGLQDAIPVAVYQAFGFEIIRALPSSGIVTLHFGAALEVDFAIPHATAMDSGGLIFYTTEDVIAPAGATQVVVTVYAAIPGVGGNIGADTIASTALSLPVETTFSHPAFTSGRDAETELQQKTRFIEFIGSISRGTVDSLRYAASTATVLDGSGSVQEFVTKVGLSEVPGYVSVHLYGSAGIPSASLLAAANMIIDGYVDEGGNKIEGYRAAGVEVEVLAMSERAMDVGMVVATKPGVLQTTDLSDQISTAVANRIMAVNPGEYLNAGALTSAVASIPGVLSCFLSGNTNILCGQFEVMRPGVITVLWL